jgi:hypothetical protein
MHAGEINAKARSAHRTGARREASPQGADSQTVGCFGIKAA